MNKLLMIGMVGVLLAIPTIALARPTIDISGLDGAEHWVWVEAEYFSSGDTTLFRDNTAISNHPTNPNAARMSWGDSATLAWNDVYLPADMSAATAYFKSAAYHTRDVTVAVNGTDVGTFQTTAVATAWATPYYWGAGVDAGSLSASSNSHTVQVTRPGAYSEYSYDGFFLYDGQADITAGSTGTTSSWGTGFNRYVIDNPQAVSSPKLIWSVTPTIEVTGSSTTAMKLNGADYTSGTRISTPGDYELEVMTVDASGQISYAGANFTVLGAVGTYTYSTAPEGVGSQDGDEGDAGPISYTTSSVLGDGSWANDATSASFSNAGNKMGTDGVSITFDLGDLYDIDSVTTSHFLPAYHGVGEMSLYYSTDGVDFTLVGTDDTVTYVPGGDPAETTSRTVDTGGIEASYLRVDIASKAFYNLPVGEVEIDGVLVPEPATMVLLGLGGVGLLLRRRRRRA